MTAHNDASTVAAQQCGLPEGLDATDMDMIRRGDMLGPALGARAASLIQSQAARIAGLEAVTADLAMDLEAELNARYGMDPVHPAEARRKERDMEPVLRARALLNKDPSHD